MQIPAHIRVRKTALTILNCCNNLLLKVTKSYLQLRAMVGLWWTVHPAWVFVNVRGEPRSTRIRQKRLDRKRKVPSFCTFFVLLSTVVQCLFRCGRTFYLAAIFYKALICSRINPTSLHVENFTSPCGMSIMRRLIINIDKHFCNSKVTTHSTQEHVLSSKTQESR